MSAHFLVTPTGTAIPSPVSAYINSRRVTLPPMSGVIWAREDIAPMLDAEWDDVTPPFVIDAMRGDA